MKKDEKGGISSEGHGATHSEKKGEMNGSLSPSVEEANDKDKSLRNMMER